MKINAISNQNYSANLNAKNSKVSAQSSKAQQYFSDSVSFSGALPKVSKLRAGIIGLAATLLAAGGFTAGTVTANAAPKSETKVVTEELIDIKGPQLSKAEKEEVKEQIEETRAKVVKNNKKIDEIKDTQEKLEFLKYAKTQSGYAYGSPVSGEITVNPYAEYFRCIFSLMNDPHCGACTEYFYTTKIRQLDEQIAATDNEEYIAELEAKKAEVTAQHEEELREHRELEQQKKDRIKELEAEADQKALEMIEETTAKLNKLKGSAKSPDDKIKQLQFANKKLSIKLDKLCTKINVPNEPIAKVIAEYPNFSIPSTFVRPTEGEYTPEYEPWEIQADFHEGFEDTMPTMTPELIKPTGAN